MEHITFQKDPVLWRDRASSVPLSLNFEASSEKIMTSFRTIRARAYECYAILG